MDERIIQFSLGRLNKADASTLLNDALHDAQLMQQLQQADALEALAGLHPALRNSEEGRQGYALFMQRQRYRRGKRIALCLLRYAAVLITGVVATWMVFAPRHNDTAVAMQMLSVPVGQRARLVLEDGRCG